MIGTPFISALRVVAVNCTGPEMALCLTLILWRTLTNESEALLLNAPLLTLPVNSSQGKPGISSCSAFTLVAQQHCNGHDQQE